MNRPEKAIEIVYNYVKERLEKTDTHVTFNKDEVYLVWMCTILGHWKALLSTTLPDGMYYEVTYNASKLEFYIDAYKKFENVRLPYEDAVPQKPRQVLAPRALQVPEEGVPIVDRTKKGGSWETIGHAKLVEDAQGLRFEGVIFGKEKE